MRCDICKEERHVNLYDGVWCCKECRSYNNKDLMKRDEDKNISSSHHTDEEILSLRAKEYGDAKTSFSRIATMWETYLGVPITAEEVAVCMTLLKICRSTTAEGFHLKDSYQDGRNYLTLAEEVSEKTK